MAVMAERAEKCDMCGHPMSLCRDPKTARQWSVIEEVCQPSLVAQAVAQDERNTGRRGLTLSTRYNG